MRLLFINILIIVSISLSAQVNPQNGSAIYDIPIFAFNDSKSGLGTGVSLNYSSGNGLIVSDKAANTGQNWSLSVGGAIYRKQNGEPDDQNSTVAFPVMPNGNIRGFNHNLAYYDENYQSANYPGDTYSRNYIDNYYPNGYMYSEFALDMVEPTGTNFPIGHLAPRDMGILPRFRSTMDKRYKQSRRSLTDREQDNFIYNFNGQSGEFVIGRDGTLQLINDSKLKIQKNTADLSSLNIRTRINEFIIRDAQGIDYKFSAYDLSEVLNPEEVASYGIPAFTYKIQTGLPTGKYTIQKWLLSEIVNPVTLEKIIFNYETYDIDVVQSWTPTYQNSEGQVAETVQLFTDRVKGKVKRTSNIIFPDGHKLDFFYDQGFTRPDFPDDDPLYKIKLSYNDQEKFTYTFDYGYFLKKEIKDISISAPEVDKRYTRLCLKSIRKSGVGITEPAYKFNYYTGVESADPKDIVPPFDCLAEDHWGYYTKSSNLDIFVPINKEVIKDLLLNSNTYRQPTSATAALGLLKSVEIPYGGTLSFEYEQNDSKDADNPLVTKVYGGVRTSKTILNDGISSANNIITNYYYKNSDGTTSGWGYEAPQYLAERQIKIWNAGNLEGYTNGGKMRSEISTFLTKISIKVANEVRSQITTSIIKGVPTKVNLLKAPIPQLMIFSMIMEGFLQRFFALFNPADFLETNTYNFRSFQSQNPIGVNYSRVEAVNNSVAGGMGKTVYEFTVPSNVRSEIPALAMPYSSKKRFPIWKYGLPLKTKIYNQAGVLLKELTNTYNIVSTTINNANNKSCKVEVAKSHSAASYNSTGTNAVPLTDFNWEFYYPVSGRAELTSANEINYSPSGLIAQLNNTITYNNDYLPKTTSSMKSNGDVIIVKNYYANDYNNINTAIQEMKIRNMILVPISSETWLIKPDATEYLLDATINDFFINSNNEVKLNKVYKLETKQPLLKSLIGEQNPAVLVRNNIYFKVQVTMVYDIDGLLKETFTPAQTFSTQLYDYNKRVVTASILNAHQAEVAYSSFETTEKGNWVYDISNLASGNALMGKKYFNFIASSTASITKQWTSSRNGRLSFWKKGASPNVTYNSIVLNPAKIIPNTETGWEYYEYYLTGTGNIILSNTSTISALDIDELRLYPKDARMQTIAFDPIDGKTAECDVNNRILYYEYDGLNRLKHIRDDRKNIIKKICYNFSGEPENCIDITDTDPQWSDNGTTMCEACPSNVGYNSGVRLKGQNDINPASPTYQQSRFVTDPTGTCPTPPVWVQTDIYCEQLQAPPYGNSGNQVIVTTDMNPCSPTYNQLQYNTVANSSACPLTVQCFPACNEPQYKCINGVCVQGTWGIIKVRKISKTTWECISAYCFPDGNFSSYFETTTSATACVVDCL
jgi:hypothetical protein